MGVNLRLFPLSHTLAKFKIYRKFTVNRARLAESVAILQEQMMSFKPSRRRRVGASAGLWVLVTLVAAAQTPPPRIFFSDLESGPNTGGEDNRGAYVTIWGRNFGSQQGTSEVTIGGARATRYPVWTDTKITFQIGGALSGDIIVRIAGGAAISNSVVFTVRPGNIYFVAPGGNDGSAGTFAAPWRTLTKAVESMAPGDIVYALNGVSQTLEADFSSVLPVTRGGMPGRPMALVAYPGASVTVGSPTGAEFGFRVPDVDDADADNWVVSQLTLRGLNFALRIGGPSPSNWRVTGNNLSCPNGDGQDGCFSVSLGTNIKFLGNEVHDTGRSRASKQYHSVYFSTDTNSVEAGWNYIHDNHTCRAIQFHSSPLEGNTGRNQYDLSVHDNLIRGDACDGINFATVDPSRGKVEAYNNVIIHVGAGPHPPDGEANYACIFVAGATNTGPEGSGVVEIYHNTCYDFGAVEPGGPDTGAFVRGPESSRITMNLRNNIAYGLTRQNYVFGPAALIRGSNNLWFGNGAGPSGLTGNINADPRFVSPAQSNLKVQSGSPAVDAGVAVNLGTDFDGVTRPQGRATDVGAFEFYEGSVAPNPNINRVADAFSFETVAVAPGKLISIFGTNLGPAQGVTTSYDIVDNRLPTSAQGTSVTINGRGSPVLYARADQINAQVPYEMTGSEATIVVAYNGVTGSSVRVPADATQPGLFPQGFHASFAPVTAQNPAQAGETVIFFATGQGLTQPRVDSGAPAPAAIIRPNAAVDVTMGGQLARVDFAGLTPGTSGVMQVHAVVPAGLAGTQVPVVLRVGTNRSQTVNLAVR
jgi:uncharacterized protein (TIGR03437 family)